MYLVSGGLNHTVNIWDLKSKRIHRSLKVSNLFFFFFFLNPCSNEYLRMFRIFATLLILSFYDKNKMLQN